MPVLETATVATPAVAPLSRDSPPGKPGVSPPGKPGVKKSFHKSFHTNLWAAVADSREEEESWLEEAERKYLTWLWHCLDFISAPLPRIAADLEIEKPKRKLGLVLTRHCGYPSAVTVDSVIEGSCAAEAHPKIHDGDTLLAVNGKEVFLCDKMTLEDVKTMMQRASSKSILKLKLLHGDESYETELRLNPDNAGHGHGGAPAGASAHDAPAHGHT